MKIYVENLIPRLKQFSSSLDKKEVFVDKPWVIIDDEKKLQKYIFRRDGELIMSVNGDVKIGKWEYIPSAKSLLIDRIDDKILLNQNFIDPAIMILKKDGFEDQNLVLANETLVTDLNVSEYLKKLYYKKNNIKILKVKSGEELELHDYEDFISNNQVSIEGEPVPESVFVDLKQKRKFIIKNSAIHAVFIRVGYQTTSGEIIIEQENYDSPLVGESVLKHQHAATDGKYKLGFMNNIHVRNGIITKITLF